LLHQGQQNASTKNIENHPVQSTKWSLADGFPPGLLRDAIAGGRAGHLVRSNLAKENPRRLPAGDSDLRLLSS
jgi:hypothetical protein